MNTNIFSQLQSEIQDYTENDIEIVSGTTVNTYDVIKRCHSYYNSSFLDNTKIAGLEKLFFNISKLRAKVASRLLYFSPEDLILRPTNYCSRFPAFILQQEIKQWNRKNHMDKVFDNFRKKSAIYGTSIIKKVRSKWDKAVVDLRRFAIDPTVNDIQDARFITLKHYLTDSDLRRMAKSYGWDKDEVEKLIRIDRDGIKDAPPAYPMKQSNASNVIRSTNYHVVYERYGEVPDTWLNGDWNGESTENKRSLFIVAEPKQKVDEPIVLFKSEWNKEYPFKDFHYDTTDGRYLGIGVIEDLFPAQERLNELSNQKRLAMTLSSLHIFQSADPTIVQNILTDLQDGDVIRSGPNGGLTPLMNEERNLSAFASEENRYDNLANSVSFVNSVLLGEPGPRSTATGDVIMNTNSTSEFEAKRREMINVLKDYYEEMVLPEVIKELNRKHIFRFQGSVEDLNYYDQEYAKILADKQIANGEVEVSGVEDKNLLIQQNLKNLRSQGKERFVEIIDGMYDDVEFDFEFVSSDENKSSIALMQQSFQFLSAVASNPTLLNNPMVKPLFYKINEMMGVNPSEIEYGEQVQQSTAVNPAQEAQMQEMIKGKQEVQLMQNPSQTMEKATRPYSSMR